MFKTMLKYYCGSQMAIKRLPKISWLSLTYNLHEGTFHKDDKLHLRLATERDLEFLANHEQANENIIQSALNFWRTYGFRTLYLGFFDGREDPSVFQYVLDESCNHIYETMEYGDMYQRHASDSVQVENLYRFHDKSIKKAALRFERHLFAMLHERGIREVRTHIRADNYPAILWAKSIGFKPDKWITLVLFNLPGLRSLPNQFIHTPLKQSEYSSFPLKVFKKN